VQENDIQHSILHNEMDADSWHQIPTSSCTGSTRTCLQASQASPVLPNGLEVTPDFISDDDANRLLSIIGDNDHLWTGKGFAKLRREQCYSITGSSEFDWIVDRLMKAMNESETSAGGKKYERPDELIVEERYPTPSIPLERAGRLTSNTFETAPMEESPSCPCLEETGQCNCYVAQMTIFNKCIQSIDKPKTRKVECWDTVSPQHDFYFVMEPNTLFIKADECLWNWRSRVAPFSSQEGVDNDDMPSRVITIKFRHTYESKRKETTNDDSVRLQQEEKKEEEELHHFELHKGKSLEELLTIIITTSPIKSNPSTELLEKTFATFHHGGHDFAYKCPKIIVCDGCRVLDDANNKHGNDHRKVSKKYVNTKQSLRNGIATNGQAEKYRLFKIALTKMCKDAAENETSPFHNSR